MSSVSKKSKSKSPIDRHPCPQCDKFIKNVDRHIRENHEVRKIFCCKCGYESKRKDNLTRHVNSNNANNKGFGHFQIDSPLNRRYSSITGKLGSRKYRDIMKQKKIYTYPFPANTNPLDTSVRSHSAPNLSLDQNQVIVNNQNPDLRSLEYYPSPITSNDYMNPQQQILRYSNSQPNVNSKVVLPPMDRIMSNFNNVSENGTSSYHQY